MWYIWFVFAMTEDQKNAIANGRFQESVTANLFRLYSQPRATIHKRDMGLYALGVAMSTPSMIAAANGVKNNVTKDEQSDLFGAAGWELTTNMLLFSGHPGATMVGAGMMLGKIIFQKKAKAQMDPEVLMQSTAELVQLMMPSPDQTFMSMKSLLMDAVKNEMDMRDQEKFTKLTKNCMRQLTEKLNQLKYNQTYDKILQNYENMIQDTTSYMIEMGLPLSESDTIDLNHYEIGVAVGVYPQFISTLLMLLKEWFLTSQRLGLQTEHISVKYYGYIKGFLKQYPEMVNKWFNDWTTYIKGSKVSKSDSSTCFISVQIPNMALSQGYMSEEAEPNYKFSPISVASTKEVTNSTCRDTFCKYVKQLTEDGLQICSFERIYSQKCERPCSKTEHLLALSPMGLLRKECMKNVIKCEYTQIDLVKIDNTCIPSKCSATLQDVVKSQLQQLEANVVQVRQTVVKFNSFLTNANISDTTILSQQLKFIDSISLQSVLAKDEVFGGNVCSGILYNPQQQNGIKQCIVASPVLYACPLKNGKYSIYPDIHLGSLQQLCPNYIKPESQSQLSQLFGRPVSLEEFNQYKATKLVNIS